MKTIRCLFSIALLAGVGGCATTAIVGTKPSATAPQLVKVVNKELGGEITTWNNPLLFGPVPEQLKRSGDIACMRARVDLEAAGYHPEARDLSGNRLPGGGYFCYPKARGDRPDAVPPRLVIIEGVLGWDRPAAFGAVPEAEQARGNKICNGVMQGMVSIGFHSSALSLEGKPIAGGGFLCAMPLVSPGKAIALK